MYISSAVRSCGTLHMGLAVAESQHGTQKPVIEDSASQASTLMWFGGLDRFVYNFLLFCGCKNINSLNIDLTLGS